MAFATPDDLRVLHREDLLVQLADADDWAGALAALQGTLEAASRKAEAYVAAFLASLAGKPVPPLLIDITCRIAFYSLHEGEPPKIVQDEYRDAIRELQDISRGKLKLDGGEPDTLEARPGTVLVSAGDRSFDPCSMTVY